MRLIKSKPRYKCDFCQHTSTESAMKAHEKRCWKNPDRYCDLCKNKGSYEVDIGFPYNNPIEKCWYCEKYDKSIAQGNEEQWLVL